MHTIHCITFTLYTIYTMHCNTLYIRYTINSTLYSTHCIYYTPRHSIQYTQYTLVHTVECVHMFLEIVVSVRLLRELLEELHQCSVKVSAASLNTWRRSSASLCITSTQTASSSSSTVRAAAAGSRALARD